MNISDFILAVHALVYLNHKADTLTSDALAGNICTNPARVRRVMTRLRQAGIVETKRGRTADSGYCFSLSPETVTLRMIAEVLKTSFASATWKSGDPHMECRVASGIAGVMDGVLEDLNQTCLKRLELITIKDIDGELFGPPARK